MWLAFYRLEETRGHFAISQCRSRQRSFTSQTGMQDCACLNNSLPALLRCSETYQHNDLERCTLLFAMYAKLQASIAATMLLSHGLDVPCTKFCVCFVPLFRPGRSTIPLFSSGGPLPPSLISNWASIEVWDREATGEWGRNGQLPGRDADSGNSADRDSRPSFPKHLR